MLLTVVTLYIAVRYSTYIKNPALPCGIGGSISDSSNAQCPRRMHARRLASAIDSGRATLVTLALAAGSLASP
jgi:hypothetical protein